MGDLLDGTRAKNAHRATERKLGRKLPFACDYQIVTDDKLFNRGLHVRVTPAKESWVELVLTWGEESVFASKPPGPFDATVGVVK